MIKKDEIKLIAWVVFGFLCLSIAVVLFLH